MGDQSHLTDFRFGAIAVWAGLVSEEALAEALAEQEALRSGGEEAPRIGEILLKRGLITEENLRRVLRVQLQRMPAEGHRRFGPIAVARRFATEEEVARALDEQSREILAGGEVRHLGRILAAMGAIRPEEVDAIFAYQAKADPVPMSEARRKSAPKGERPEAGEATPDDTREGDAGDAGDAPVAPEAPARPVFLPRGVRGFVADNCIWLACAAAAAVAVALAVFREAIFG